MSSNIYRTVMMVSLFVLAMPSLLFAQSGRGLHGAVSEGDAALVSRLIEEGADVNARNEAGMTPLMVAAGSRHVNILTLLVEKGADVNAKLEAGDYRGLTALMVAVFDGNMEAAKVLIDKGADVNAKYEDRWSALTIAAAANRHAIADLLVRKGADKTNLEKNVAEFRKTRLGMTEQKAHLAYLHATLKNAYTAALAYLFNHPGSTITTLRQLEEAGFSIGTDDIMFVKADISENSGSIVFLAKRLDASNSTAAAGLRTGEGMVNFAGELNLPKLK